MNSMPENISGYVLLTLNFVVSPSKSIKCSSILHLLPDFMSTVTLKLFCSNF